jgi:hypothetical protein
MKTLELVFITQFAVYNNLRTYLDPNARLVMFPYYCQYLFFAITYTDIPRKLCFIEV